jgi:hypothetical protein
VTNEYSTVGVCTRHLALRGVYEGKEHRCGCQPPDDDWREQEWAGYDIAALIDLCHVCVRDVVKSGTRWSWYGCETCRSVNNRIATAILSKPHPGNQVLPLGRHSMMNGRAIGVDPPKSNDPADRVTESMVSLFEFAKRIFKWKKEEGRHLIELAGSADTDSVPLDDWLVANPSSPGASADAIARFIDEEELPDIRELDGLRKERQLHLEGTAR